MEFKENYARIDSPDDRSFDATYWTELGPEAIFEAAYDMLKDYLLLNNCNADEPRLLRTVESFRKV